MIKKNDTNFSFKKAALEARSNFPKETADITFIDMSAPEARDAFKYWFSTFTSSQERSIKGTPCAVQDELFDELYMNVGFAAWRPPSSKKKLLVFNHAVKKTYSLPFSLQFIFDHELGHLIVEGGMPNSSEKNKGVNYDKSLSLEEYASTVAETIRSESAADTYACLIGLQRKTLTAKDIDDIALFRASELIRYGKYDHVTIAALDTLLSYQNLPDLESLSPGQIKDIAGKYANQKKLSVEEIFESIESLAYWPYGEDTRPRSEMEMRLLLLADCITTDSVDSLTFRVAARVFSEALKTGTIDYIGQLASFGSHQKWEGIKKELATRLQEVKPSYNSIKEFIDNRDEMLRDSKQFSSIASNARPSRTTPLNLKSNS